MPEPQDVTLGEWLRGTGPESDIAVCTRVRLARNVQGYSFSPRLGEAEARELCDFVHPRLGRLQDYDLQITDLTDTPELDRRRLMECHLISRDHCDSNRPRGVAVDGPESISIMVNEEDHVRAQVFRSGFSVEAAYQAAENLDNQLHAVLPMAFSEEFGFLTACPTNTGTGLRISVMLHLPGLVWAEEIEKATNTVQKIHLAVRGLYGEGSKALGDFYQLSNQVTLGRSEAQIIQDVSTAVARMLEWEREVREALLKGRARPATLDRVFRALGTLERAQILSSEETLGCLSKLRFGIQQGLIEGRDQMLCNRALLLTQPAHLQWLSGCSLNAEERDRNRAALIQSLLQAPA